MSEVPASVCPVHVERIRIGRENITLCYFPKENIPIKPLTFV